MKKALLFIITVLALVSCKDEKETAAKPQAIAYHEINNEPYKKLYGYWTGMRIDDYDEVDKDTTLYAEEGAKLSLKINRIIENKVYGVSMINGEARPVKGEMKLGSGGKKLFTLREPGTMEGSGIFELVMANDTIIGIWKAYIPKPGKVKVKKLELVQRGFKYNPDQMLSQDDSYYVDWGTSITKDTVYTYKDGDEIKEEKEVQELYRAASDAIFKLNGSTQKLTEEQLKELSKLDLEVLRNTIFARHGYSFKRTSLRYFFEMADWYVPVSGNVDKELTKLEKENIALLKRLEQYATDHYDYFGR
ncbi:YARHG domain-containing protein [Flavobacterium sp. RHBU_3]|uniref:YARHG domain-containing protein n=1 Tax=Flavobacterium sp. RHBU_3 TaxID=3391184 RepID=UPI003984FB96